MTRSIAVDFHAKPLQLTMASRDKFLIGFEVKNIGTTTIDPKIDYGELRVNGQPSHDFSLTVVNGSREKEWYALPPGKSVRREWPLGLELFPAPGEYTLELIVSGVAARPIHVHVAAR